MKANSKPFYNIHSGLTSNRFSITAKNNKYSKSLSFFNRNNVTTYKLIHTSLYAQTNPNNITTLTKLKKQKFLKTRPFPLLNTSPKSHSSSFLKLQFISPKNPKDISPQICSAFHFLKSNNLYLFIPNSKHSYSLTNNSSVLYNLLYNISIPFNYKIRILSYLSMPPCIKNPCLNSNIKFQKKENHCNIIWHLFPPSKMSRIIREMNPNQHYNHFISTFHLGRKDFMYRHYLQFNLLFPNEYNYIPQTFILPDDASKYTSLAKKNPKIKWIAKPVGLSRGRGVHILQGKSDYKDIYTISLKKHGHNYLISKYIINPHLINNKKYDLRVYVLITSFSPLKIYMYKQGLVRFASEEYKQSDFDNIYIHLTNYAINSKNPSTQTNIKWSFEQYKEYFMKQKDINIYNTIMNKIRDIIIKTIITSIQQNICDISISKKHSLFELYGFDILVDGNYNVWLIEVNVGPSMHCSSLLDTSIKSDLFSDIVNVIGVKFYNHYDRDKCYTITKEESVDKTFDKLYVNTIKREVVKEFNKDNLKFKGRAYESNYYQDVINRFIEEKCRSEVTDFEMIFPCKENITFYSKFILNGNNGNTVTNDDTIVIWQYLLTH